MSGIIRLLGWGPGDDQYHVYGVDLDSEQISLFAQLDFYSGDCFDIARIGDSWFISDSAFEVDAIHEIDIDAGAILRTLDYNEFSRDPQGLTGDGTHLLLHDGSMRIRRIDPTDGTIVSEHNYEADFGPNYSGIGWDGTYVYGVLEFEQQIMRIDLTTDLGASHASLDFSPTDDFLEYSGDGFFIANGDIIHETDMNGNLLRTMSFDGFALAGMQHIPAEGPQPTQDPVFSRQPFGKQFRGWQTVKAQNPPQTSRRGWE